MTMQDSSSGSNTQPGKGPAYVWPCYWGGASGSDKPPQIHDKVQELRREIGGLEARRASAGPSYPVKSAKELEQKMQPALDKLGLSLSCSYEVHEVALNTVPPTQKGQVVRSACWMRCTVKLCAADGSFVESQGVGGGLDADDKAYGKAATYSRKDAILKMLAVPEKNMIDTDDEEDAGAQPASPVAKVAVSAQPQPAEPPVGELEAKEWGYSQEISLAGSLKELKAISMKVRQLPIESQKRLAPGFVTRQGELAQQEGAAKQ